LTQFWFRLARPAGGLGFHPEFHAEAGRVITSRLKWTLSGGKEIELLDELPYPAPPPGRHESGSKFI
jgi:hypothetical protein